MPGLTLALIVLFAAPTPDAVTQSRAHFEAAQALYSQGRYAGAILEFEEADRLRPHGDIRFNIARCYQKTGDLPKALWNYAEYLRRVPDAADAASVTRTIQGLEAELAKRGVQPADSAVSDSPREVALAPAAAPPPVAVAGASTSSRDSRLRFWSYGLASGAGVCLASGIVLGGFSSGTRFQLLSQEHPHATTQALYDTARSQQLGANLAFGAAAALAGTAVVLFFLGKGPADPAVAP